MAERCRREGIRLTFVIFPTHTALQDRIDDFGLRADEERFRKELTAIAPVLDYDFPSQLTRDRANFEDPFHFRDEVARRIIEDLWRGGDARFARLSRGADGG